MNKLLKCHHVSKTYQEGELTTEVLKGVSFEMDKSELVAIVGTSGSGKSTLLHILGALDDASEGEVEFLITACVPSAVISKRSCVTSISVLSINSIIYWRISRHWKMWRCLC